MTAVTGPVMAPIARHVDQEAWQQIHLLVNLQEA
jgi:hypothetical protein